MVFQASMVCVVLAAAAAMMVLADSPYEWHFSFNILFLGLMGFFNLMRTRGWSRTWLDVTLVLGIANAIALVLRWIEKVQLAV